MLLSNGIRILLKNKIHIREVDRAHYLLKLFVENFEQLYGEEKCSFNVHQLLHMADSVRKWGPLWVWSAFPFEDAIGYYKKLNHGPNKVDAEIMNSMKILNAFYILRYKLFGTSNNQNFLEERLLQHRKEIVLNSNEIECLQEFSPSILLRNNKMFVYGKTRINNQIYTSEIYKQQKKRKNFVICWKNSSLFGIVPFYIGIHNISYAMIRKLERDLCVSQFVNPHLGIDMSDVIIPVRLTYNYLLLPLTDIEQKVLYFNDTVNIPPNSYERKQ